MDIRGRYWIPACAGMTAWVVFIDEFTASDGLSDYNYTTTAIEVESHGFSMIGAIIR
jgi:hypothetical protein